MNLGFFIEYTKILIRLTLHNSHIYLWYLRIDKSISVSRFVEIQFTNTSLQLHSFQYFYICNSMSFCDIVIFLFHMIYEHLWVSLSIGMISDCRIFRFYRKQHGSIVERGQLQSIYLFFQRQNVSMWKRHFLPFIDYVSFE